ncbi:hypothetical protein [Paenibacillus polymyxa]|uniref:hypothetical protein n=1 Tax=Paenibacillus polymyxa TaxID=1406 RepID=UPI000589C1D1|nr:hypothetical protein [Paenibacillus polymyxa]AJE54192.1 hypothetical protein RE92_24660 [Paenibacillus polymyxa]
MVFFKEVIKEQDEYEKLIGKMTPIVNGMVTSEKFRTEFKYDLKLIKKYDIFAWFVYDYGTYLFPLGDREIKDFQENWLQNLSENFGNVKTSLFIGNRWTGELSLVNHHQNVVEQLQLYIAV